MRVSIITIHDPDVNYGSTLQSCATCTYIRDLGHDASIINYRPNYKSTVVRLKIFLTKVLFFRDNYDRRKKINAYFAKNAKLSRIYRTERELYENPPDSDVYITGSDVIWNRNVNPEGGDSSYYLGFVKSGRKVSFSASMGEEQSLEDLAFISRQIEDFSFVSVREELSRKQLSKAANREVYCTLDPVFLLPMEYYLERVNKNKFGQYCLIYLMSFSDDKAKFINKITNIIGLSTISFGGFREKAHADIFIRNAGVEDFLTYIYHANFIVTDSFHCVAFCLIFHKQFIFIPSVDSNLRIENLLNYVNLIDRIYRPNNDENFDYEKVQQIDYDIVQSLLDKHIEYTRLYLKRVLDSIQD